MKKIIITLSMFLAVSSLFAQEETTSSSSLDLGMDVQSRYIWRGIQLGGNAASAQPWVEFSTGGFTLGAWGAYGLGGDQLTGNEADFYAGYAFSDAFSVTVTDYFFPSEFNGNGYWPYSGHVFEGMLSFAGTDSFPIGISVATNFAGDADKKANGNQSYSTYVELSYGTKIGETDFSITAGGVFNDDAGYYLTDGSGLINLSLGASKEIKLTDSFSLPVNGAITFNPDSEDVFFTFGFSL
jgi:hypothetical protein